VRIGFFHGSPQSGGRINSAHTCYKEDQTAYLLPVTSAIFNRSNTLKNVCISENLLAFATTLEIYCEMLIKEKAMSSSGRRAADGDDSFIWFRHTHIAAFMEHCHISK
jgi:hypothetical protein